MTEQIDRQPFLLYETVEMLYKHVNGVSFRDIAESMARLYGSAFPAVFTQKLECLERITREVCEDLPVQNPQIQRFFRRFETDAVRDNLCLAKAMTLSFFLYAHHDLETEAKALKRRWADMQTDGFTIGAVSMSGLEFHSLLPGQSGGDLVEQMYALNYPAEYKLEMLQMLTHYDRCMDELIDLILPYARRLQLWLDKERWLMETTADYWQAQFTDTSPSRLVQLIARAQENLPQRPETRILFSLMNCTGILYDLEGEYSAEQSGCDTFIIGCAVTIHSTIRKVGGSVERTCAILRSISDKSKFEVLQRLGTERSYCQKLAEEMNINAGHMSRILMTLFNYGFLTREQEQSRYYYTTDKESISAFLSNVRQLLAGGSRSQ
ncbi:MAG TPA: hypothetical protein IAB92_01920 [Candidatus Faecousia faecigallinarum]|nr:hypothetical protein [Candidatus Faecousia faecigallinarum]